MAAAIDNEHSAFRVYLDGSWPPEQLLDGRRLLPGVIMRRQVERRLHVGLLPLLELFLVGIEIIFGPLGHARLAPDLGEEAAIRTKDLHPLVALSGALVRARSRLRARLPDLHCVRGIGILAGEFSDHPNGAAGGEGHFLRGEEHLFLREAGEHSLAAPTD